MVGGRWRWLVGQSKRCGEGGFGSAVLILSGVLASHCSDIIGSDRREHKC